MTAPMLCPSNGHVEGNGHIKNNGAVQDWHAGFLPLMPIIRRHARSLFGHLSRHERDDAFAEVTALAMIEFVGLLKRNQAESLDPAALARSAGLKVLRSGRACGRESCRDVLSPTAQQRRGFTVERLRDSCDQEQLRTRIRLREVAEPSSAKQLLQPPPNGDGSSRSMSFTHERRRRRKAEKRLRSTDLEFRLARRIQQKLFPAASPMVPGFDIAGMTCPAEATGGDYYDFVPMADDGVGVVIGDVSGHGFGPALLMASTRAYMRAFAQTNSDLGELLALVNRVLIMDMEDARFVTVVLARFNTRTRSLVYASAGHPTAYVLNASGQIRVCLPSTSLPLGLALNESFTASGVIPLQPGELVVLLSDGVIEASAPDGAAFGWTRAVNIVRCYRCDPATRIVDNLYHAVRAFSQNAPQLDDITAVVIKVNQQTNFSRMIQLCGSNTASQKQKQKKAELRLG